MMNLQLMGLHLPSAVESVQLVVGLCAVPLSCMTLSIGCIAVQVPCM